MDKFRVCVRLGGVDDFRCPLANSQSIDLVPVYHLSQLIPRGGCASFANATRNGRLFVVRARMGSISLPFHKRATAQASNTVSMILTAYIPYQTHLDISKGAARDSATSAAAAMVVDTFILLAWP